MQDIRFEQATSFKQKPQDESKMGFGKLFTDYMFEMDYSVEKGWHDPRVVPYHNFSMDPATSVLHYGQEIFEGMKCYRRKDGGLQLFRPRDNFARMNRSAERMAIPQFDEDVAMAGLEKLLEVEKDWVPHTQGATLYIRPTIIAMDAMLGVHAAHTYKFYIILSPSGAYYAGGLAPVDIYVEDKYVRAVRGGIGFAKTGGNYAASIRAGEIAEEKGYTQVLWLDGVEQKYVEEVGAMNMMFVIDGKIVTPMLNGSILPGITRDSILKLAVTSAMRPRSAASPSRRSSTPPTPAASTRPSAPAPPPWSPRWARCAGTARNSSSTTARSAPSPRSSTIPSPASSMASSRTISAGS